MAIVILGCFFTETLQERKLPAVMETCAQGKVERGHNQPQQHEAPPLRAEGYRMSPNRAAGEVDAAAGRETEGTFGHLQIAPAEGEQLFG